MGMQMFRLFGLYRAADDGAGGSGADTGDGDQTEELSVEDLKKQLADTAASLKKANKEAADRRKKIDEFETKEREAADKDVSELAKTKKALEDTNAKLQDTLAQGKKRAIRHAVEITAGKLGFIEPEHAFALADLNGVEVDDEDHVVGVEDVLKSLAKKSPYLVKKATEKPKLDGDKGPGDDKNSDANIARRFGISN